MGDDPDFAPYLLPEVKDRKDDYTPPDKNVASCIQSKVIFHYYYLDTKDYKKNYDKSGYVFGLYYPDMKSVIAKTLQRSSGFNNQLKLIMKIQAPIFNKPVIDEMRDRGKKDTDIMCPAHAKDSSRWELLPRGLGGTSP